MLNLYSDFSTILIFSGLIKHLEDNLDMYYEELNKLINNSEADGDSASGVVLLVNGKVVAGEATNISRRFD